MEVARAASTVSRRSLGMHAWCCASLEAAHTVRGDNSFGYTYQLD
jgi:hypothetical protein